MLVVPVEPETPVTSLGPSEVERTTDEQKRTDNKQVDDVTSKMADADLDSDDDLEPFDLSNDTPVTSHAAPRYVRQCMEGEGGCRIVYKGPHRMRSV